MKRTKQRRRHPIIKIFFILIMIGMLYSFFSPGEKDESTVTQLFMEEGGAVAYNVDRQYSSDFYMIIDFNEQVAYSFGGELIHLFIDEVKNIKDDSFEIGGRKYNVSLSRGLDSMTAKTIEFTRTGRTNYLSRIDLGKAQQVADQWREKYGEEDRR